MKGIITTFFVGVLICSIKATAVDYKLKIEGTAQQGHFIASKESIAANKDKHHTFSLLTRTESSGESSCEIGFTPITLTKFKPKLETYGDGSWKKTSCKVTIGEYDMCTFSGQSKNSIQYSPEQFEPAHEQSRLEVSSEGVWEISQSTKTYQHKNFAKWASIICF